MDRVVTLSNKLQEQLAGNASVDQLLLTVEMLQSELMHQKQLQPKREAASSVAVHIAHTENEREENQKESGGAPAEKTVEILQVDEAELEAELEEIKRNAQARNNLASQNKPPVLFDPVEDIPTLAAQQPSGQWPKPELAKHTEIHEMISGGQTASLNEKLKQAQTELGDSLLETPIKDLRRAIGVNDRFVFINDLFRGDEAMYERSIKTINGFSILPEAEYWINRELKLKLGWSDKNDVVKQFDQLVRRRFS
jgi:hypothetical protein